MTSPPVLAFLNVYNPFTVEMDTCHIAIGAVLVQSKDDNKVHHIGIASWTIYAAE